MDKVTTAMVVIVAVAVVTTVVAVVVRLEVDMIFTLALILVIGVALAVVGGAAALVVKARTPQGPQERERIIREVRREHTIDGRKEARPFVVTVPGQGQGGGLFPEVLRAAFVAGTGERRRLGAGEHGSQEGDGSEGVVEGDWEEWTGPIGVTTQNGRGRGR